MKLTKSTVFTIARVAVGVALIAYLAGSGAIEWSSLARLLSSWWLLAATIALFFIDMVVTAWRLCVLLRPSGLEMSLWASFRLTLIGLLFSTCLPGATGGDAIRIYYAIAGNVGRRTEVATIMLLDRALGMVGLLLLPIPFALLAPAMGEDGVISGLIKGAAVLAAILVSGALIFFFTGLRTSRAFNWLLQRMPLGRHLETMVDTLYAFRRSPGTLLAGIGISVLAHLTTVAIMVVFARAMNPGGSPWQIAALIPLGLLANGIPITPGGLGVGEAAFDRLFQYAGLTGGIELMLGWRFLTLVGALGGLVFYLQGQKRYVHAQEATVRGGERSSSKARIPVPLLTTND